MQKEGPCKSHQWVWDGGKSNQKGEEKTAGQGRVDRSLNRPPVPGPLLPRQKESRGAASFDLKQEMMRWHYNPESVFAMG